MGIGFRLIPKGMEESAFKPIPEGWVLKVANPLCFGPSRSYLVSDEQKPAVAARVRRSRGISVIAAVVMIEAFTVAMVIYPWLRTTSPKTFAVWGAMFAVACVLTTLVDHLVMWSIVRDLPRSTQTVRMIDAWTRLKGSMSTKTMVVCTVFCGLAGVVNFFQAIAQKNVFAIVGAPFMIFLGIFYGTMLVARLREKATAGKG